MARQTKQQAVYEALRREILTGELAPGTRLVIRDLAVQMQVSDIPVREALKRLDSEGLVDAIPYTGFQVSRLSLERLREISEIREALEAHAAALAAERMDERDLALLADCLLQMERDVTERRLDDYTARNRTFHEIIYRSSGNQKLYDLIFALWDDVARAQAVFKKVDGHPERSLEEHRLIYQALRLRAPELAARAMVLHRHRAMTGVQKLTEMEGKEATPT